MTIEINLVLQDHEVPDLREAVGWDRHDRFYPSLLEEVMFWAGMRNDEGQLVAFGYVVGPGMPHGYLEDVMVHPDYQRQGVGQALVCRLLEECDFRAVEVVTVTFDSEHADFYYRCGFSPSGAGLWRR